MELFEDKQRTVGQIDHLNDSNFETARYPEAQILIDYRLIVAEVKRYHQDIKISGLEKTSTFFGR